MLYTHFRQFSTFPYAQIGKIGHLWLFWAQKRAILGCFWVHRGIHSINLMFSGILSGCMRVSSHSMQFLRVYLGWGSQNTQFLAILGCFFWVFLRWLGFGPNEPHYMFLDFNTHVLKKKIHWCMFFFRTLRIELFPVESPDRFTE